MQDYYRKPPGNATPAKEARCYFDVDGVTIEVALSRLSGRETIRADGKVVAEERSFRFTNWHAFSLAGHDYKVLITVASILRAEVFVQLYRDDKIVDSDVVSMLPLKANGRIDWTSLGWWFLIGAVIGALIGFFPIVSR
jgi:hypothetical protein